MTKKINDFMVAFINSCYGSLFKTQGQHNSFKFIFKKIMTEKKILLMKFLDEGRMEILDSDVETDCTNTYLIDEWAENVIEAHQSVCDSGLDISLCEGESRDVIIIRKTDMELLLGYCRD
ncbi:MAG: hypothetical protein ACYS26_18150, partial [Planctomycetota bacterium]